MAKCEDCDLPYSEFGLDTMLPNEQWILIHPEEGTDLLCANCIARRAEKLSGTIAIRATIEQSKKNEMTWNYRIIHHNDDKYPYYGLYYGLHEVFYDEDKNIEAWTSDAFVVGDDAKEIVLSLAMMLNDAKSSPVLIHSELENERTRKITTAMP